MVLAFLFTGFHQKWFFLGNIGLLLSSHMSGLAYWAVYAHGGWICLFLYNHIADFYSNISTASVAQQDSRPSGIHCRRFFTQFHSGDFCHSSDCFLYSYDGTWRLHIAIHYTHGPADINVLCIYSSSADRPVCHIIAKCHPFYWSTFSALCDFPLVL